MKDVDFTFERGVIVFVVRLAMSPMAANEVLDAASRQFKTGQTAQAIATLQHGLRQVRANVSLDDWSEACTLCQSHGAFDFITQDPFCKWAYEKPRGYPGDAILMDLIYRHPSIQNRIEQASQVGKAIYECGQRSPAQKAVKYRLAVLAKMIDGIADAVPNGPEILSVASGHLREAHNSKAINSGRIRRFVALDQDDKTVAVVASEFGRFGVQAITTLARDVLTGRFDFGQFDFIYCAGLTDYLGDRIAQGLTTKLFQMLKPNGRLLIPNFAPDIIDAGFMEAFLDWKLTYRSEANMRALTRNLPRDQLAEVNIFQDPQNNIFFLQLTKSAVRGASLA